MKPLSIQQIRQITAAKALAPIPATAPLISSISSDSRRLDPGSLFIALSGETYDGHNYLRHAAAAGAVAALVQRIPDVQLPNMQIMLVPDTRKAMGKLATHLRKQMLAKVIAVAGSNGKTSTKHLIDAALCLALRGSISPKSFNNDIGVPLTIFPADPLQDYLVLEVGTNHPGEIKVLTDMAQPDIAVITNCGPEHLEFLGDLLGVRRENASIIEGLNPKGLLVVNGDDPDLLDATANYPGKRVTFGFSETNDLFATDIRCDETGVHFKLNAHTPVFVPLLGKHTAANALAAIAVARRLGLHEDTILAGLANAHGAEMRLQLQKVRGITLLNDAYNANPASMKAALDTLASLARDKGQGTRDKGESSNSADGDHTLIPSPGTPGEGKGGGSLLAALPPCPLSLSSSAFRSIAILGDMRELGESSARFHRELGQTAAACNLDALYCVGPEAKLIAESAQAAGMNPANIHHFPDSQPAAEALADAFVPGDIILLKASRTVRLERIAAAITQGRAHGFFPQQSAG